MENPREGEIDVAQTMHTIRDRVRQRWRDSGRSRAIALSAADRSSLDADMLELQKHVRDVSQTWAVEEQPFVSHVPILGPFIARFREAWNSVSAKWHVRLILQQQVAFNRAVMRSFNELVRCLEGVNNELVRLNEGTRRLEHRFEELAAREERGAARQEEMYIWQQDSAEKQEGLAEKQQDLVEKQQGLAEKQKDLEWFYKGLVKEFAEAIIAKVDTKDRSLSGEADYKTTKAEEAFTFDYYEFNRLFSGRDEIVERLYDPYVKFFQGCQKVLDIGCGRGAFLELLRENGIRAYGIDVDEEMVRLGLGRGLDVKLGEALTQLRSLADESLDGIFMGHVVEHLEPDRLMELVRLCYAKLKPGSYLVFETPNTLSLFVLLNTYLRDPTHVQRLHPETYRFIADRQGFREVHLSYSHPVPEELWLTKVSSDERSAGPFQSQLAVLNRNIDRLNEVLYGYQNVAVIAKK